MWTFIILNDDHANGIKNCIIDVLNMKNIRLVEEEEVKRCFLQRKSQEASLKTQKCGEKGEFGVILNLRFDE